VRGEVRVREPEIDVDELEEDAEAERPRELLRAREVDVRIGLGADRRLVGEAAAHDQMARQQGVVAAEAHGMRVLVVPAVLEIGHLDERPRAVFGGEVDPGGREVEFIGPVHAVGLEDVVEFDVEKTGIGQRFRRDGATPTGDRAVNVTHAEPRPERVREAHGEVAILRALILPVQAQFALQRPAVPEFGVRGTAPVGVPETRRVAFQRRLARGLDRDGRAREKPISSRGCGA
jgi:hypothetical protein